jgi:glycosyltransferase involved in cell wall biosynthesis
MVDRMEGALMRVLLVTDALNNGGAERQLALLAASLPKTHSVTVFTFGGGEFCDALRELGVPVEVFPRRYRYDITPGVRMLKAASAVRPDVVHSWGWMASWAFRPFCRRWGTPLVGVIRRAHVASGGLRELLSTTRFEDLVVANSRAGLRTFGVPEGRGRVVYNGFEPSRLESIPKVREHSRFPDVATVVMTGRMVPQKDWSMLFRAARRLEATDPGRWRFLAVGDGLDRTMLMSEAADLISSGVLAFPPGGREVLPIVASADIGVLLTNVDLHAEGCSNSIMEYMACGLPVLCTDCGGNPELVEDGVTGYLIPAADDAALANRLRELRGDPGQARDMGAAGAARLRRDFSLQAMVDGHVAAYDWACRSRAGSGGVASAT